MDRDAAAPDAAMRLDLAREASFMLAHLQVTPASLTVEAGGWSQRLEPRVMQVLVVLAQANAGVVGRGALNARVWGGRVVGDDAINRSIQALRRVAGDAPSPKPFVIETIPRVGYRLTTAAGYAAGDEEATPGAAAARAAPTAAAPLSKRRWMFLAGAGIVTVAAISLWRWAGPPDSVPTAWRVARAAALPDLPPGASDVALSPDGRKLAYRALDANGRERIFLRAAESDEAGRPVSPGNVDARHPAWRPDSAALAYVAYDAGRPCELQLVEPGGAATVIGVCEIAREPRLAWSTDGRSLIFADAPGVNAVQRIGAIAVADGRRTVISSPPGDSMGDDLPVRMDKGIVFQRQFGWSDHGWIARDDATGRERLIWRRRGVAASFAEALPDGALAVAWTRAGASGLDIIDTSGRVRAQPLALGPVAAMSASGDRLLLEIDRSESALARAGGGPILATVRGRVSGPVLLPDGRLRFPAASAGVARIWERGVDGSLRSWGKLKAARVFGPSPSRDGRWTAAMVTGDAGREIVVLDEAGRISYRWHPNARSLNPAAWSGDGRQLIAPVLDAVGWRLYALDPFDGAPPLDLALPGFAVVQSVGAALYAVRAGEATGVRELWRLDGGARRLPIDLTLQDIVNWRAVEGGVWLPDRGDRDRPSLVLRDFSTGGVVRRLPAPGLAGAGAGLAADARGPVYVRLARDAPEYEVLTLAKGGGAVGR